MSRATMLPEILVEALFADEPLSREETAAIIHAVARDPVVMRITLDALLAHFNKTARGLQTVVRDLAKDAKVRGAYVSALASYREKRAASPVPPKKQKNPASTCAAAPRAGRAAKPRATRSEVTRAIAQYRKDHWGQEGSVEVRELPAADPRLVSVELGELVSVTYRTKKGRDQVLTDYEHAFKSPRPVLSYNRTGLLIAGGKYHVEPRGIVD